MMEQLTLTLTVEEANLMLKAISQLPYIQVHDLINKIQQQAEPQLQKMQEKKK